MSADSELTGALAAIITATLEDAQSKAGEPLSPWKPEGFALLIAERVAAAFEPIAVLILPGEALFRFVGGDGNGDAAR